MLGEISACAASGKRQNASSGKQNGKRNTRASSLRTAAIDCRMISMTLGALRRQVGASRSVPQITTRVGTNEPSLHNVAWTT